MLFFAILFSFTPAAQASSCTYETWDWDAVQRRATQHKKVMKAKSELAPNERGETPGCSVCREDQVEVQLPGIPPFKICKALQDRVLQALSQARAQGFPIRSVVAYRVGKSKGALSSAGQRTEFSNHSYGTAVDINSETNGLYDNCAQFGPHCRLIRGGEYLPSAPGAITPTSPLYRAMTDAGFKWGGEMVAKQKDFMHFSITGM